jgi:hypothetical protein
MVTLFVSWEVIATTVHQKKRGRESLAVELEL